MDLKVLKYYISVAQSLSFTEAAARNGVSQSAISQQISELERDLGTQLIVRTKRPLQLTWAGKVLLDEASALLSSAAEAANKVQLAGKGITGYLDIGFLGGIEKVFLPEAMRDFRRIYPSIYAGMHQYNWPGLNEALMRSEVDVGFTMSHRLGEFPDIVGKSLRSDVLCVALHHTHPLASQETVDVPALAKEPFVMFTHNADYLLNDLTHRICAEHGFAPNVVNQSQDLQALLFMIESGLGIMIAPGPIREVAGPELRFVELNYPDRYFDVMIAWNRNSANTSLPVFVEHIYSYFHN
jgi:DNA-binding transcriptional LysR family regulator